MEAVQKTIDQVKQLPIKIRHTSSTHQTDDSLYLYFAVLLVYSSAGCPARDPVPRSKVPMRSVLRGRGSSSLARSLAGTAGLPLSVSLRRQAHGSALHPLLALARIRSDRSSVVARGRTEEQGSRARGGERSVAGAMGGAAESLEGAPITTSAVLMSASKHIGSKCGAQNRAFLDCKRSDPNPEKCLQQGQNVTRCVISL